MSGESIDLKPSAEVRVTVNIERARAAFDALQASASDEEALLAAKRLESAACQLRRALKQAVAS
jgi:hypothetical protein